MKAKTLSEAAHEYQRTMYRPIQSVPLADAISRYVEQAFIAGAQWKGRKKRRTAIVTPQ